MIERVGDKAVFASYKRHNSIKKPASPPINESSPRHAFTNDPLRNRRRSRAPLGLLLDGDAGASSTVTWIDVVRSADVVEFAVRETRALPAVNFHDRSRRFRRMSFDEIGEEPWPVELVKEDLPRLGSQLQSDSRQAIWLQPRGGHRRIPRESSPFAFL